MISMEENMDVDERENQTHYDVSNDLKRPPLLRIDPPKTTENQLDERTQYSNTDISKNVAKNGNRNHGIPKQPQTSLGKKSKKKSSNKNKASIENANVGDAETMSDFACGTNEVETEQRFTSELQDILPQRTWIQKDFRRREIKMPNVRISEFQMRTSEMYSTSSSEEDENKSVPMNTFPKGSGLSWLLILGIAIFLGIMCVGLPIYFVRFSSYFNQSISIEVLNVAVIVSQLKSDFERQPDMSFRIIKSALNTVSKPGVSKTAISKSADTSEPDAPAIILLLAAEGAEKLTSHLGQKLVETVSHSPIRIQGSDYTHLESNAGKKKIDDLLKTLSNNSYDAVLVEDLHLIPGSTALMFHTYCDHENAPYKRVVYVMTVASESRIPKDSKGKFWDETVRTRLSRSWSDIDNDQMEPLLTRLTVGVAAITADSN